MNNIELETYVEKFGEPPYLLTMMTYDHPFYKMLMGNAVLRGEPLTDKEVEIEAETLGQQFDITKE